MKKGIAVATGIGIAVVIVIMISGLTSTNNTQNASNSTISNSTVLPPAPVTLQPAVPSTTPPGRHLSINLTESVGVAAH